MVIYKTLLRTNGWVQLSSNLISIDLLLSSALKTQLPENKSVVSEQMNC